MFPNQKINLNNNGKNLIEEIYKNPIFFSIRKDTLGNFVTESDFG